MAYTFNRNFDRISARKSHNILGHTVKGGYYVVGED